MENDNSVQKLVQILETLVLDLDEKKKYLETEKEDLESVSRLLAYTKDNIEMVGIYADQELIINNLEKIGCSKEDYKACCYLLKSEDSNVKGLPQYESSYNLITDIVEFFSGKGILDLPHPSDVWGVEGHVDGMETDDFQSWRGEMFQIGLDG